MTRLSIITAVYNCLDYTKNYIYSLENSLKKFTNLEYEILIVDDCSSDGSRKYLKSIESNVIRVFFNDSNMGFSWNNNFGASKAKYDIYAFLNNDLVLKEGWLEPMIDVLDLYDNAGSVGNIQVNPNTGLIDHAGIFFDLLGKPAHAWKNRLKPPKQKITEWNAVTAACMIVKKEIFWEVNGFDISYINGCEDVDFCIKLKKAGYNNYVANTSVIKHHVSTSEGRHDFNAKNTEILLKKWHSVTENWGESEWPIAYLQRYARQWWRFNIVKLIKAIWLIIRRKFCFS